MVKKYSNSVKIRYPPSEKELMNLLNKHGKKIGQLIPTIEKIILYGSFARKEPRFGSDVDLLFVVRERITEDFETVYESLVDLSLEFEWSPLFITEDMLKKQLEESSFFYKRILKEGITIWPKN